MAVGAWLRSRQKSRAHGKVKENWIAFEILSAVRLPWWVDAMVNLAGFYMAVVFLRQFRKPRGKNFITRTFFSLCHAQWTKRKWGYSWSNRDPDLIAYFVKRRRFVGRRRLESPSLLCFMHQLRRERRLRKSKKKNNKLEKRNKTRNPSKIDAICAQNV